MLFPGLVAELTGGVPRNGMTAGGFIAIVMTAFVELTKPRSSRLETELEVSALEEIRAFIGGFASRNGRDAAMAERLDAASEETC